VERLNIKVGRTKNQCGGSYLSHPLHFNQLVRAKFVRYVFSATVYIILSIRQPAGRSVHGAIIIAPWVGHLSLADSRRFSSGCREIWHVVT